jgi:hypothetical protein
MATLLDLKNRIKTVANIKKITRAMQLVAAAKFNRAQNRAKNSRPYTRELDDILGVLSTLSEDVSEEQKATPDELAEAARTGRRQETGTGSDHRRPGLVRCLQHPADQGRPAVHEGA